MGNTSCYEIQPSSAELVAFIGPCSEVPGIFRSASVEDGIYKVTLSRMNGGKLGLDVNYMVERNVLPVTGISGGLAAQWNAEHPKRQMSKGDSIIEVNGISGDVTLMLEKCQGEKVLELTLSRALSYENLLQDLESLISVMNCGPLMIQLSHDASLFNTQPMRALRMLRPISDKYCPMLISHTDLWVMAANVAIRMMNGPDLPCRFGRIDPSDSASLDADGHPSAWLNESTPGFDQLKAILQAKGFGAKAVVALSGVGAMWSESDFDERPLQFDNTYFKQLLKNKALVEDPKISLYVQTYAEDQQAWFNDFTKSWVKLQEMGFMNLRDTL